MSAACSPRCSRRRSPASCRGRHPRCRPRHRRDHGRHDDRGQPAHHALEPAERRAHHDGQHRAWKWATPSGPAPRGADRHAAWCCSCSSCIINVCFSAVETKDDDGKDGAIGTAGRKAAARTCAIRWRWSSACSSVHLAALITAAVYWSLLLAYMLIMGVPDIHEAGPVCLDMYTSENQLHDAGADQYAGDDRAVAC